MRVASSPERAAGKLSNAGRRASGRGDMPAAASLMQRAAALLPEEDPLRLDLLPELAGALMEKGDFAEATAVADETAAIAGRLEDRRLAARARLVRQTIDLFSGASEEREDEVVADIEAGIVTLSEAGDEAGLAHAYRLLMIIHGTVGRYDDAAFAAETAVTHSRRAGDPRSAARAASGYATVALGGPTPVGRRHRALRGAPRRRPRRPQGRGRHPRRAGPAPGDAWRVRRGAHDGRARARDARRPGAERDRGLDLHGVLARRSAGRRPGGRGASSASRPRPARGDGRALLPVDHRGLAGRRPGRGGSLRRGRRLRDRGGRPDRRGGRRVERAVALGPGAHRRPRRRGMARRRSAWPRRP